MYSRETWPLSPRLSCHNNFRVHIVAQCLTAFHGFHVITDPLQAARLQGFAFQFATTAEYILTERIEINCQLGYTNSFINNFIIKAGDTEIEFDSAAIVRPDGSATHVDIDPKAEQDGIFLLLGMNFIL